MPIHCLLSSPSKLLRGRRASDSNTSDKSNRNTSKSLLRNFDEELLQHVQEARRHSFPESMMRREGGSSGRTPSPSLPYSKDFGSFDLTLCLAEDGRCVVLVEYEQRVFVNGRQIYIQDDGNVLDRLGRHTAKFQRYYDRAIEAKKLLRGIGSRSGDKSPVKSRKGKDNCEKSPESEETAGKVDQGVGGNGRRREMLEMNYGITFESELTELEAAFGRIIARLCKIILDVIGHETTETESTTSEDDTQQRDRLEATLDRLSDQFQSIIELSSSLKVQHDAVEAVQDMWMAGGVMSGGYRTGRLEIETIESSEDHDLPDAVQRRSSPQSSRLATKPHTLWEENQTLRNDVRTLEIELQQLEVLHKKVEDQFFEVESDRVDAQNQLAATTAENEALKKQLTKLRNSKGGKGDTASSTEGSASNLLSRFTRRLSGSARHTSPVKGAPSSTCSLSSEEISVQSKSMEPFSDTKKEQDILEGFQALDRHHNLRSEMKRLREVYKNMEDDMEGLGEDNRSLRMRVLKMERERKDMNETIRKTNSIVEDRNREIEHLDSINTKLNASCSLLASEKAALGAEVIRVNALCAETGSRLRTLERELMELEKTYKGTESEKLKCRDKLDLLNQEHLEECIKTSKLLKEKTSVEGLLSRLRREQGELAAELDKLRVENGANSTGRLRAEKVINRLELDLGAADRIRAELTEEVHHLRRSLAQSETTCKSLEVESADYRDRCSRLDAEAGEMRSRSEELYLGNRMLEEENSCLKEMNQQLRRENAEMQDTVSSLTDTNAGIRAKMRQWNRDNISMENKMKKLVKAKAELHGVIKQLNTVHSDIENRFEKLDSEYADFEVRLTKGGQNLTTGAENSQSSTFEEDFERECARLKEQLHNQDREGDEMNGEKVKSQRSKIEVRKRNSSMAVAKLKNEVGELEKEILERGGEKIGEQKRSPQNGYDVTFVSACSDFDSGELGLWWDNTGELSPSISGTEENKS